MDFKYSQIDSPGIDHSGCAMMRFENQVAVVTGAGRGIGHAIAVRLANEGARVASVSRSEANAQRTADEINASHADAAKAYAVDVADHAAVQQTAPAFSRTSAASIFWSTTPA